MGSRYGVFVAQVRNNPMTGGKNKYENTRIIHAEYNCEITKALCLTIMSVITFWLDAVLLTRPTVRRCILHILLYQSLLLSTVSLPGTAH